MTAPEHDGTDVDADPDQLDEHPTPLTTDGDQLRDDDDPNTGEGGAG
jgi:hypothetical protein